MSDSIECKYATFTNRPWAGAICACRVVECRNPKGLADPRAFNGMSGVRYATDEKLNLLPNADCLHVRSRFCGKQTCPLYDSGEEEKGAEE